MTIQATFAATIVDEWVRAGVRHAVIAPGSRSAPLALALLAHPGIEAHVRLDERSAAFFALGIGLSSGMPAIVVTTSGTAAAECHAAVVEADLAGVPMIVCTADRPPRLHGVGSAQTVDQTKLFGSAVRFFAEPGVALASERASWRSVGSRLVAEAVASARGPGPVHANLAFDEPLSGAPDELSPGRPDGAPWHAAVAGVRCGPEALGAARRFVEATTRGVIVCGAGLRGSGEDVAALAGSLGWPVFLDPRAFPGGRPAGEAVLTCFDALLRCEELVSRLRPKLVLHLGAPPASKVLARWCAELAEEGAHHVVVDAEGRFLDPDRLADAVLVADPGALCAALRAELGAATPNDPQWAKRWALAATAAEAAIDAELAGDEELSEPLIARRCLAALPPAATLVVSSSMPVRDLEWFGAAGADSARVVANRGANGIDGVVSTTLGVAAATEGPVLGLLGDLAFFHDLSGLVWGVHEQPPKTTLVVVDNAGGGIFSFLEHATALDPATFERVLATPQRPDVSAAARALGATVHEAGRADELDDALRAALGGPAISVVVARTDRLDNVAQHEALAARVRAAVVAAFD